MHLGQNVTSPKNGRIFSEHWQLFPGRQTFSQVSTGNAARNFAAARRFAAAAGRQTLQSLLQTCQRLLAYLQVNKLKLTSRSALIIADNCRVCLSAAAAILAAAARTFAFLFGSCQRGCPNFRQGLPFYAVIKFRLPAENCLSAGPEILM